MMVVLYALMLAAGWGPDPGNRIEKVRNGKVAVFENSVQPGASTVIEGKNPSVFVYVRDGAGELSGGGGKQQRITIRRGEVAFFSPGRRVIRNTGPSEIRFVRVEFVTAGEPDAAKWGADGLSPNYRVVLDNQYARAYDISIPAGTNEPLHTHKDRVVICLTGSEIVHLLPDGRQEPSSLKTGDVVWRRGGTHVGQNRGKADFRAVAVEPK